jgi:hypothetical protein
VFPKTRRQNYIGVASGSHNRVPKQQYGPGDERERDTHKKPAHNKKLVSKRLLFLSNENATYKPRTWWKNREIPSGLFSPCNN